MRVTTKGQITIPVEIREKMGFFPETEVDFVVSGERGYLVNRKEHGRRGKNLIARMRGKATVKLGTDDIMALTRDDM